MRYQTALTAALILVVALLIARPAAADPVGMQQLGAGLSAKHASGFLTSSERSNIKETWNLTPQLRWGNDYMHQRYYSPILGRFISVDPVMGNTGSSQSQNRYSYVLNNPVKLVDPTGEYVGVDDVVFSSVGALVGLGAQGVSDLISGKTSSLEDYAAAAVGGAVGGEALLYTGPVGAGAAGGLATNLTKQGLKNLTGKQNGFDATSTLVDTGLGAATGLIKIPKVPGVTSGRNSMNAIFKQIVTKAQNGTISNIGTKTALKMVVGRTTDTALLPGAGAAAAAVGVTGRLRSKKNNSSKTTVVHCVPSHEPQRIENTESD